MFHECQQQFVQSFWTGLRTKEGERVGHDTAVELLAITRHDHVAGFVDQAHGEQGAGMDGEVGILVRFPYLVHLVRKAAARGHIGKHHVAVEREERVGELVAFPRLARNMKFHHRKRAPNLYCQRVKGGCTVLRCHALAHPAYKRCRSTVTFRAASTPSDPWRWSCPRPAASRTHAGRYLGPPFRLKWVWMQLGVGRLLSERSQAHGRGSARHRRRHPATHQFWYNQGVRAVACNLLIPSDLQKRRGGRVVEGTRLESGRTRKGTASSNLALSARLLSLPYL